MYLIFFFQAEDGIRDWSVTGVQTCALPICCSRAGDRRRRQAGAARGGSAEDRPDRRGPAERAQRGHRSEERRVGKECRTGWGTGDLKKKKEKREQRRKQAQEEKRREDSESG